MADSCIRVLIITGEYPPMRGGIGDYTWLLAQTLRSLGVYVVVLCRNGDPVEPGGVPVERCVSSWGRPSWRSILEVAGRFNPDWIHIQYNHTIFDDQPAIHFLPWRLRLLRRRPRVAITFHDLNVPYLFRKAGPLRRAILSWLALGCDAVVTTNEQDWRRLRFVTRARRELVRVPVGSTILSERPCGFDRTSWRSQIGLTADDFLIVQFGYAWGLETLTEAMSLLIRDGCPVHLLILGCSTFDSDDESAQRLANRLTLRWAECGLDGRVHRTGYLPSPEVSGWLAAADIAGLPYPDGACFRHTSMLAALAHGLPVVTTQTNVLDPGLEHGQSVYLVPPNAPVELARALERLLRDKDLRNRLSQGAKRLARSFTWDVIAQRHLHLYEGIY